MFLSPGEGERLGEGASQNTYNPLTQPLPLAGERNKKGKLSDHSTAYQRIKEAAERAR